MDSVAQGNDKTSNHRFTAILPATGWTVESVTRMSNGHWDAWVDRVVAFAQVEDDDGSYLVPLVAEGFGLAVVDLHHQDGVFRDLRHQAADEDEERAKALIVKHERVVHPLRRGTA